MHQVKLLQAGTALAMLCTYFVLLGDLPPLYTATWTAKNQSSHIDMALAILWY
ncbi:hypothetical protein LZ31DRAFT_151506 [Colletotrichum somersetense]|nr:hypothetical protein LZ31DRAFT_151506 [Colletotrichum somersetense]